MRWIALDLGSSYTKCAAFDEAGVLQTAMLPAPSNMAAQPLRYEIDADIYFRQVETLLEQFTKDGACGLLLSTQMHGYVLTDAAFRPLSPYVSWQDRGSAPHLDAIRQTLGADATAPSGVPVKGNLALCSLMSRMREGEALPEGGHLCTLGGYMIGRLCGVHVCHGTNAAPTGLADVQGGGWNERLIERAGLSNLRYPRIVWDLAPVGVWRGIPVYPDLGDQQVCAAGAALALEQDLHVSLGTAGLIGCLTHQWGPGAYENRPWLTPGMYLRTVSGLPGGRHVRTMHTFLQNTATALTGVTPTETAVWAFMSGMGTPQTPPDTLWDTLQAGPEAFLLSFYADMARAHREAAERMGFHIRRIAFSGGCAEKNPALRRTFAETFRAAHPDQVFGIMEGMRAVAQIIAEKARYL